MKAVCSQRRHGRYHWVDIARYLKVQREYVPLYVMHLRSKDGAKDVTRLSRIEEMDKELPTAVALHFRKLAHAQDMRLREREQKKASEDKEKPPPRTWVSWLGFTGTAAPASANASAPGDSADASATAGGGKGAPAAPDSLAAKSHEGERSQTGSMQLMDPTELSLTRPQPTAAGAAGTKDERGFLTADEVQVLEEVVQAQVFIAPMPYRVMKSKQFYLWSMILGTLNTGEHHL
jgi:hypothetical protein